MAFDCTKCGACCRQVRRIHPDWPTRPDGSCIHLGADNRCAIYEVRPQICRVDVMRPITISAGRWYQMTAEACAQLQKEEADALASAATAR